MLVEILVVVRVTVVVQEDVTTIAPVDARADVRGHVNIAVLQNVKMEGFEHGNFE